MIRKIIEFSVKNCLLVVLLTLMLIVIAAWAAMHSKLDAVPDLSDVQVLILTNYPGQAPDVVQEQVTYPLETALVSVPGVQSVRGESMFEFSLIHVVFKSGTDLYWARSRVLEYLNYAKALLPKGIEPQLGPDATGVGWAYQYALFPGWYCRHHPRGIWHDPIPGKSVKSVKWFAHRSDAPAAIRLRLVLVRGFTHAGKSPLSGKPLIPANINLGQLRAIQDWFLRFALESIHGVAEVAPLGGFVQEYQVLLNPSKLRAYHLSVGQVIRAIQDSNNDVGGSVIEVSELQYMIRSRNYLKTLDQLNRVPVGQAAAGTPILLHDVAAVQIAGEQRQGICEWDGRGESVGGIVVVRSGADTYRVIENIRKKIADIRDSLPPGVLIETGYDRSNLINRAVHTLSDTLLEEILVVALVCMVFLLHGRSSLVAIVVIPASMLISLAILYYLNISANIMSLSGIAIAIGVVVDSAIVMIENAHQHINADEKRCTQGYSPIPRSDLVLNAAIEVGPSLFFSLLIITISFLPIFILPGESGKMFSPLALTKTFAMASAAILSITIVPVLMIYLIGPNFFPQRWPWWIQIPMALVLACLPAYAIFILAGHSPMMSAYRDWMVGGWILLVLLLVIPQKIIHEHHNPVSAVLQGLFTPVFSAIMAIRWLVIPVALVMCLSIIWPIKRLGTQFTPPLNEGDLEYMPTTYPGISILQARYVLQQSDKIIKSFPEVKSVFGQMGRAITATDDAPINMVDTIVRLKPRSLWPEVRVTRFYSTWPNWLSYIFRRTWWPQRKHISVYQLKHGWTDDAGVIHLGMDEALNIPGFPVYWTMPVANRTNMVNTGSKTLIGIRVQGAALKTLGKLSEEISAAIDPVRGTTSAIPNQTLGGYYLDIHIKRNIAARYGLTVAAVQRIITMAIGGDNISTMVRGVERFPINVRYFRDFRGRLSTLKNIPITTPDGSSIALGMVAALRYRSGPPEVDSRDAQTINYINITTSASDLGGYVARANAAIRRRVVFPAGYTYQWIGQYQQIQLANQRLKLAVPLVLLAIFILLFIATGSVGRVLGVLLSVPFGLIGAFWALWLMHYQLSPAVWVGIIALAGLCAEMGLVLILYLDISFKEAKLAGRLNSSRDLYNAVYTGTVRRIRPQTMTVSAALFGLVPLLWVKGAGTGITRHLAVPMIGGLITSFGLELLVLPALYLVVMQIRLGAGFHAVNASSTSPENTPSAGGIS